MFDKEAMKATTLTATHVSCLRISFTEFPPLRLELNSSTQRSTPPEGGIGYYNPLPCALLPTLLARIVTAPFGTRRVHTGSLDPTARRLPVKAPLAAPRPRYVPHSVASALTGPCHSCGLPGHEPGGARRASQAAHTADPYATCPALTMHTPDGDTIGAVKQTVTRECLEMTRRPSGSPQAGSASA